MHIIGQAQYIYIMDNIYKLFSPIVCASLKKIDLNKVFEIRIRVNRPIIINALNKSYYLTNMGVSCNKNDAIILSREDIEAIVYKASNYSVYATSSHLKNGYLISDNGIRIGLCGEVIYEKETIVNIKNITSLVVSIPHHIENCSYKIYEYCLKDSINNTLIISPPGAGKTTMLRDLIKAISSVKNSFSTLVIDERYEIAASNNGNFSFDLGEQVDVLSGCNKAYAFLVATKVMRPNLIAVDEISSDEDVDATIEAYNSGINVIATCHGLNIESIKNKIHLKKLLNNGIFSRYIVLSKRNGNGTIEGIFDENLKMLYCE